MKTNVLEFLPIFEDAGAQRVITNYCRYIDKKRFSITVLSIFAIKKGALYRQIQESKCRIYSIFKIIKQWDASIFTRAFKKILGKKYICFRLKRVIVKNKISVIHAHVDVLQYINKLKKFIEKNHIKVIYTCHSAPSRWLGKQYIEENKAASSLLKYKNFLICALHKNMCNEIKTMFQTEKVLILENPIDFKQIKSQINSKKNLREELSIPSDSYVIGDICSLTKSKNLFFLVDIFKKCLKLDHKCYLLLVCHGNPNVKRQIQSKIEKLHILDRVLIIEDNKDVYEYLSCIDVFCSPSLCEGFGLSLLEAQGAGINCVFSDVHPLEINLSFNNIVCSNDDTPEKWAKCILSLKTKKPILKPNINKYDIFVVIKKIENLYCTN